VIVSVAVELANGSRSPHRAACYGPILVGAVDVSGTYVSFTTVLASVKNWRMWRRNTWFRNEMGEKQAEFMR
jgi:hypothetical protein